MASNETILLQTALDINHKSYTVKLTATEIYWEISAGTRPTAGPYSEPLVTSPVPRCCLCFTTSHASSENGSYHVNKTENQSIRLRDIVSIHIDSPSSRMRNSRSGGMKFQHMELVSMSASAFSIHAVQRHSKHIWRTKQITFCSNEATLVHQWVDRIKQMLEDPCYKRPKHLLVFVNPYGGKKKGEKIYSGKIAPLFDLANITTDVTITQRANHALGILKTYDLTKIDGIVSVGGDGMFSEIFHGLLDRTLKEAGINKPTLDVSPIRPNLRIGIIPAGSTDTVAFSTVGINDPVTSALHIIVGNEMCIDLGSVHDSQGFLAYNVSLLGYGYFGDCMLDSENNRWMGPTRYDWSGLKKVVQHRVYEGEVSYIPSTDNDTNPQDGTRCLTGCQVCKMARLNGDKEQTGQWQTLRGRFIAINSFMMSCRCPMAPDGPAPCAHSGDGCTDLVIVRETSRANYVKFLLRCKDTKSDQMDLPFVTCIRAKEFKFRPITDDLEDTHAVDIGRPEGHERLRSRMNKPSVWNRDGEVIHEPNIHLKVHNQLLPLFAGGIEEDSKGDDHICTCCM